MSSSRQTSSTTSSETSAIVAVSRKQAAIGLPSNLAQRAAFLARLHRERNLQTWVERVVRERVELEERAFTQARRELTSDRKSTRLNSSHVEISYAVFCLKKKKKQERDRYEIWIHRNS